MGKTARVWTTEEKEYLKEIVVGKHYYEIVELMNEKFKMDYTISQIKGALNRYKLKTGLTGRFKKGHIPATKGTKGICKANKTSFKKGNIPINKKAIGSERINIYGYTEIKIAEPNVWALKHKLIWEQKNGKIEKGYVLLFADGNKRNIDVNNLILISNKQLLMMNRNKLIKDDADLTRTGLIIADIYQKIFDKKATLKLK